MWPRSVLLLVLFVYWDAWTSVPVVANDIEVRCARKHVEVKDANVAKANIGKCCELEELLVDDRCTPLTETNETAWQPEFVEEHGPATTTTRRRQPIVPSYELKIGRPKCAPNEHQWHVYHYSSGPDSLGILPDGVLRHYIVDLTKSMNENRGAYGVAMPTLNDDDDEDEEEENGHPTIHYDYQFGHYCADKVVLTGDNLVATYAMLCVPDIGVGWTDTDYLLKQVIDPAFHAMAMVCYLIVAVVYFVLPQLRDLFGNVITSMSLCLVINQCASTVRIFTKFGNHVDFMIADTVMYISLTAAFFWLSALGYYVWSSFKSRNIFLRVTDGRKYCYYSSWVWGLTACIAGTAIFAHYTFQRKKPIVTDTSYSNQGAVDWLAVTMMMMGVGTAMMIDFYFVRTTKTKIKRISTYGRIHHKMKYNFRIYVFLWTVMHIGWISLLLSRFKNDLLIYCNIVVNLLQALLVLYMCVFGQRRVTFLLKKTCNCCNPGENPEGLDWGEEMTAINAGY